MKTDSFSSLTKKKCKCPNTLMYHDEYAQANHFNLLLPRGSCYSAPLPENTASSVSIFDWFTGLLLNHIAVKY